MSDLTTKQRRFVEEFCVDFNATQAAIRAGYSKKWARQQASQNLSKRYISEALAERLSSLAQKADVSAQRVLDELASIAFAEPPDSMKDWPQGMSQKTKALELLGRYHALFTDRVEHQGEMQVTWRPKIGEKDQSSA